MYSDQNKWYYPWNSVLNHVMVALPFCFLIVVTMIPAWYIAICLNNVVIWIGSSLVGIVQIFAIIYIGSNGLRLFGRRD